MRAPFLCLNILAAAISVLFAQVEFPGTAPGVATAVVQDSQMCLGNQLFTATFVPKDKGLVFGGMRAADGTSLVQSGSDLFVLKLQNGQTLTSANMTVENLKERTIHPDPQSPRLARQVSGKAITATFTSPDTGVKVEWAAVLRDGSHYLRQQLSLRATDDTYFSRLEPMHYLFEEHGATTISGNTTHGTLVVNDALFAGLETPMSVMQVGDTGSITEIAWNPEAWQAASFSEVFSVPASFEKKYGKVYSERVGPIVRYLKAAEGAVQFSQAGSCHLRFEYKGGHHKLNLVGVQLVGESGDIISEDVHKAHVGSKMVNNVYTLKIPAPGVYQLRYWVETKTESIASTGCVSFSSPVSLPIQETSADAPDNLVRGIWIRKAPLGPKQKWNVSSVVGLLAPEQHRRSLLAYIERERPVPYRPFIHHNDWYEIGITCNNDPNPAKRHSEAKSLKVLKVWEKEMYKKRGVTIDAFVLDDGWDEFNSLWNFHSGFPRGFAAIDKQAKKMKAGIGTWLGPVGGYGSAKNMRLGFWNKTHPNNQISNFKLSNKEYFDAFVGCCTQMVRHYDMRYFKFDGISAKYHANGPDNEEDAEGILSVLAALRKARPDLYINTTVGTWASPFWLLHSDCVWRQKDDFDRCGTMGDDRDRWMTYRDRLVYEVFVQSSHLMPINSVMTHGLIITKNGPPRVMSKDPDNCIKEMRAAFGCGSSLVELYVDHELMNQNKGQLWDELADCIKWVRRNADVLADVHWVGGNPWNGTDGDIYGWAAWNKSKCTLTLRNSSAHEKTLTSTLRQLLDIPPAWKGVIKLSSSFKDQRELPNIMNTELDVDSPISITLKPFEIIVTEGTNTPQ